MDAIVHPASPLRGTLTAPPDKAICHRAVLAAAVAEGLTRIHPWPTADDCQRSLEVAAGLGVRCTLDGSTLHLEGRGAEGLRAPTQALSCGESGTTLRLAAGVLAGQPFTSTLDASPSLRRRPMQRIAGPLAQMGAVVEGRRAASTDLELCPPLVIRGRRPLQAIRYEMPVASAQVKSAILFAGLFAEGRTTVIERSATRDHTERMLRYFGARLLCAGPEVSIEPHPLTSPGRVTLPGDLSSAAFFVVAACCVPGSQVSIQDVGLNPTRLGFLTMLERMGARIATTLQDDAWEPRGMIAVHAHPLHGIVVEPRDVPGVIDELPILMVAAACAQGTTRFEGVGELRAKETDRLQSMLNGLRAMGARIRLIAPDAVEVQGTPLRAAAVDSAGDHRTAMSLMVAGLLTRGTTTVRGIECVAKSFPDFADRLRLLAGPTTIATGKSR